MSYNKTKNHKTSRCTKNNALMSLGIVISLASLNAVAAAPQDEQREALMTLIHLMETDIATRTEVVDADYAPGQITVLRGKDLEARGKRTVGEALHLLTGYDLNFQPLIRGVGGTLSGASGKVKFMLNGVSINDNLISTPRTLTFLPIHQVERIEFIRGPGSAIHGEFALSGVINVITRETDNSAFVRYGSFDTYTAGVNLSEETDSGWKLSADLAGWQSKGPNLQSGTDALYEGFFGAAGQGAISNAPGQPNLGSDSLSAFFAVEHQRTKLAIHHVRLNDGNGYGLSNFLPIHSDDKIIADELTSIELTHSHTFTPDIELRAKAGYQEFTTSFDTNVTTPPGFFGVYPDGIIFNSHYAERRHFVGSDLTWHIPGGHTLLLGAEYAHTRSRDVIVETNQDPVNLIPGTFFSVPLPNLVENPSGYGDRTRRILSLYAQDEYAFNEQFIITGGLRYDSYSDTDNNIAPRIAGVYHPHADHTFKVQYGEAFRPPNFAELYNMARINIGNPDLEPEQVKTFEFAYVYKTSATTIRAVAFHSEFDDLVIVVNNQVQNSGGAKAVGLELEWEHEVSSQWKIDGNLAFVDAEDTQTDAELAGSAELLGNLGLIFQPHSNRFYNLQVRHIGKRNRGSNDSRASLGSQTTLDLTANLLNVFSSGVTLRAGVKNLFDEDVRNPAPANTFREDYPLEDRSFWIQLEKSIR